MTALWPIDTDDQVELLARECGINNRRYMTPRDYSVWCEQQRQFVRLAALPADAGWRSMDSAPRNGTRVLATIKGVDRAVLVAWNGAEWVTFDGFDWRERRMLAWMPVPAPQRQGEET